MWRDVARLVALAVGSVSLIIIEDKTCDVVHGLSEGMLQDPLISIIEFEKARGLMSVELTSRYHRVITRSC